MSNEYIILRKHSESNTLRVTHIRYPEKTMINTAHFAQTNLDHEARLIQLYPLPNHLYFTIANRNTGNDCPYLQTRNTLENKQNNTSRVMRKTDFLMCENKGTDQLRSNRKADQRLCFCNTDSTIPLFPKSEISSLWPSSMALQPGLCGTRSKTPKTGFLTMRLIQPTDTTYNYMSVI